MEKVLSADYHGSTRTSTFGDLDSRSSVALSDERLEELSEEALEAYYDRLQKSVKTLKIENVMLERFSERVDPSIMTYINQSLSHHSPQAHSSPVSSSHMSLLGKRSSIDSVTSTHTIGTIRLRRTGSTMTRGGADRISKLTLPQKMDILMREMELVSISMEKSKEKWKITCKQLDSEIEEAKLRFESARIAREELEEGFSQKWIDPITGQVPAEKYLRYIKEKIRLGERSIEKHRLKSSTLLLHYNRAKLQLHHKEELHEGLTAVDFEQNSIINNDLKKSLEKKNQYFVELKKIVEMKRIKIGVINTSEVRWPMNGDFCKGNVMHSTSPEK
ncbi:hypothetical protein J437_LFUL009079 [Ladona fulva]|uniref:Cilia- and flagella-associated protein 263 n=1 Tax=Ladona fulva TaxID=123851 RepID=A0A8K0NVN0_LADFU|nr:hypothetical protein J437_LFUL009079 [Ladona fulva]